MSDTLRAELDRVAAFMHYAGNHKEGDTVDKAIAELDRLEAEVKKPRLPEGWKVEKIGMSGRELIGIQHDDDERHGGFWLDQIETKRDSSFVDFLSAFLPVPSTEPVQAAGDMSDRETLITELREFSQMLPEGGDVDPLIEVFSGLADRCVAVLTACIEASSHGKPRNLSIPKEWSKRKGEEIGSDECAAGLLAADPFNMQAPASPSDQGQGSLTPMNTETAEKPKPVSLVEKFSRERIGGNIDYWAKNTFGSPSHDQEAREIILWLLRTLDQERGV